MPRVTLTKAELQSPHGQQIVSMITRMGEDGKITLEEISELLSLIDENGALGDLGAAVFLRTIIHDIIADGKIDIFEQERLRRGLARVLPKEIRATFEETLPQDPDSQRPRWYLDDATERQWAFLRQLGYTGAQTLNKGEASELISSLLESRPPHGDYDANTPTPRQLMVLRFWNRKELFDASRRHVSDFLDSWYQGDAMRKIAWEMWKSTHGNPMDPNEVPLGIGLEWLVKANEQVARDMEIALKQSNSIRVNTPTVSPPLKPKGFFARLFSRR